MTQSSLWIIMDSDFFFLVIETVTSAFGLQRISLDYKSKRNPVKNTKVTHEVS